MFVIRRRAAQASSLVAGNIPRSVNVKHKENEVKKRKLMHADRLRLALLCIYFRPSTDRIHLPPLLHSVSLSTCAHPLPRLPLLHPSPSLHTLICPLP